MIALSSLAPIPLYTVNLEPVILPAVFNFSSVRNTCRLSSSWILLYIFIFSSIEISGTVKALIQKSIQKLISRISLIFDGDISCISAIFSASDKVDKLSSLEDSISSRATSGGVNTILSFDKISLFL